MRAAPLPPIDGPVVDPAGPNNTFSRTAAAGGFSMTNTSTIPQNSFLA